MGEPQKLGCEDAHTLKNTYTPLDLYAAMQACVKSKQYEEAGLFFALAGAYGTYDRMRVRDKSSHQAIQVLKMAYASDLPEDFKNHLGQLSGTNLAPLCAAMRQVGAPSYFPSYMIEHGLGTIRANLEGVKPKDSPLDDSMDPQQRWQEALDSYLHCPD